MSEAKPTVYYDGACPLCRREINFYKRQTGAEAVNWVDVSDWDDSESADGLSRHAALKRFHVRKADGTLVSGASAFAELWRRLPRFRLAGQVASLPIIRPTLELGYRGFLFTRRHLWRSAPPEKNSSNERRVTQ